MDRSKPPGQWNDGVREPRVVLSPEPNRELLGPLKRRALDLHTLDHRAANQVFDTTDDNDTPAAPVPEADKP